MSSIDMSDSGDIPSDESICLIETSSSMAMSSGLGSRTSTSSSTGVSSSEQSIESFLSGLGKDDELARKYPAFFKLIDHYRSTYVYGAPPLHEFTTRWIDQSSDGPLFRDAVELCRALRRTERSLLEKERDYDLLQRQNREIRETYVKIYAKAEQEEEYISNILLKRIQKLKNDKETLAQKYEQEEEYLTNDLMRRIQQLQSERDSLEGKMKSEQGILIDNLLQTIRRMETEMASSRKNMDRMRKEKIDQENALENEQELLFNTLGKQMDQLNNEKRKMAAALSKAYEMGFSDSMLEPASPAIPTGPEPCMPERPPSATIPGDASPTPRINRSFHNEMSRLRQQCRSKDTMIAELQAKLEAKEQTIRELSTCASESSKDKFVQSVVEATQKYIMEKQDKIEMGPPSVPSMNYNEGADMDDTSSRSSFHSDMY